MRAKERTKLSTFKRFYFTSLTPTFSLSVILPTIALIVRKTYFNQSVKGAVILIAHQSLSRLYSRVRFSKTACFKLVERVASRKARGINTLLWH